MRIGHLAQETEVSRDTIRLYAKRGMLVNITRPHEWNNYKEYGVENVKRIQIIKYLKQFSFTLQECKEVLDQRDTGSATCSDKASILGRKLSAIEAQIATLQNTRQELLKILG